MSSNEGAAPQPEGEVAPNSENAAAPASSAPAEGQGASASSGTVPEYMSSPALLHHLHKAKALSERLMTVMAQREARLAEIKHRVSLLEQGQGQEGIQPLVEAENNMKEAHNRMKGVLNDLAKELELAGVNDLPSDSNFLADIPVQTGGQVDEVAFLYKQLLLVLGEWKASQQKLATDRAEQLAKQVQSLRDQVSREQQETKRIRERRAELERLRDEKQGELDALHRDDDKDTVNGQGQGQGQ